MKHILLTLTALTAFSAQAHAHDFWVAPNSFQVEKTGVIPTSVMVGHPKDRSRWALNPHRVIALKSIGTDGITDHQSRMEKLTPSGDILLSIETPGTHLVTIETTSAISVLPAEKFNSYLKEEGLTPIIDHRKMKDTQDKEGSEIYSRRGKALIQVGPVTETGTDYVTRPVGMTLEIVPSANPYGLEAGEALTSTVYYRGQPTKGITIGLISLDTDAGIIALKKTDAKGHVTFERPDSGNWMLHAVWSDPLEDTRQANYDTIFSSLSFGFDK